MRRGWMTVDESFLFLKSPLMGKNILSFEFCDVNEVVISASHAGHFCGLGRSCVIDRAANTNVLGLSPDPCTVPTTSNPPNPSSLSPIAASLRQYDTMSVPRSSSTAMVLQPIRNVVSASALYPFKGIWYFCVHREFWPLFGRRLIPLVVTSIVVLGLLFTFTYLPQVAFLAIFHGPVAWFNAVFLVLGEGQVVIALLFEALLVDETLVNVFDVCISPLSLFSPPVCVSLPPPQPSRYTG